MKYLASLIIGLAVLAPAVARADVVTYEESWEFLYQFDLVWDGGGLVPPGDYIIAGGDPTTPLEGTWEVAIYDARGRVIGSHRFEPSALATDGHIVLRVPHEFSGTDARFFDPTGVSVLRIDLRGSRTCNDNGYCDSAYGEEQGNCPADCGGSVAATGALSGSITRSALPGGVVLGSWLLRLSFAAAGVLLLVGASRMLDRGRRP